MTEDFRIEHRDGWHPWVVYLRLCPVGFFEHLAARYGWRKELWVQVYSADYFEDVAAYLQCRLSERT